MYENGGLQRDITLASYLEGRPRTLVSTSFIIIVVFIFTMTTLQICVKELTEKLNICFATSFINIYLSLQQPF